MTENGALAVTLVTRFEPYDKVRLRDSGEVLTVINARGVEAVCETEDGRFRMYRRARLEHYAAELDGRPIESDTVAALDSRQLSGHACARCGYDWETGDAGRLSSPLAIGPRGYLFVCCECASG